MTPLIVALLVVGGLALIIVFWVVGMYNGLVGSRNQTKNAWSQIDVQLKRRHDLIPNLVETVKGYAAHERGTFEAVTNARAAAVAAGATATPEQRAQTENVLSGALRSLFAVAENYPQLQAVQNFKQMQEDLRDTEDKIQFARRFYNGNVRDYNTALMTFPTNLFASMFGFTAEQYFEVDDAAERAVPQVKFTT